MSNYQINEVYSFEGYVIDSHLSDPEASFLSPTPEYTIEIQSVDPCIEQELIDLFEAEANPHMDKTYAFRGSKGLRFTSVVKPRTPQGIQPGSAVTVRAKPTIAGGSVSNCALTLVLVMDAPEQIEPNWDECPVYNF